jgi:hypothetical protein
MKFSNFFCQIFVILTIANWNTVIKNASEILKYAKCHHSFHKSQFLPVKFSANFGFRAKISEI